MTFVVNSDAEYRKDEVVVLEDLNVKLLKCLEEMGKWYCENIATYQFYSHDISSNKKKYDSASQTAKDRFDEYASFKNYTGDDRFNKNIKERVEGKKEGARALYYAKDIDVEGRPHYDGIIDDFEYNDGSPYMVGSSDYNNGAYDDGLYRVGDDCSDFAMAVILRESGGNRGQTATASTTSKVGQRGLQLHETNTEMFRNFKNSVSNLNNTGKAMEQLGYRLMDIDRNTVLKPGDILMTINDTWKHIEFYYGYQYKIDIDESGRQVITDELERVESNGDYYYSTFGWGSTHSTFPSNNNYFRKNGNKYYLGSDSTREYTRLYRKDTDILNTEVVKEMLNND